jgi:hypothetical protein
MLVVSGFFRDNSFVPDREVSIPDGTKATLSIQETAPQTEPSIAEKKKAVHDFFEAIRNTDEVLPPEFDEIVAKGITFNKLDFS